MRIVFWSHWHPNSNGTDYWDVLGIYPNYDTDPEVRRQADEDAYAAACDRYSYPSKEEQDEDGIEDEGPEVLVQVYDPEYHDGRRSGGGSFAYEFDRMTIQAEVFNGHN